MVTDKVSFGVNPQDKSVANGRHFSTSLLEKSALVFLMVLTDLTVLMVVFQKFFIAIHAIMFVTKSFFHARHVFVLTFLL